MNTERFPKSPNAWDSLGEVYARNGDRANAIKSFKKALSLNPSANIRSNSEKFLKELGGVINDSGQPSRIPGSGSGGILFVNVR